MECEFNERELALITRATINEYNKIYDDDPRVGLRGVSYEYWLLNKKLSKYLISTKQEREFYLF